jgi:hypothetical protein
MTDSNHVFTKRTFKQWTYPPMTTKQPLTSHLSPLTSDYLTVSSFFLKNSGPGLGQTQKGGGFIRLMGLKLQRQYRYKQWLKKYTQLRLSSKRPHAIAKTNGIIDIGNKISRSMNARTQLSTSLESRICARPLLWGQNIRTDTFNRFK